MIVIPRIARVRAHTGSQRNVAKEKIDRLKAWSPARARELFCNFFARHSTCFKATDLFWLFRLLMSVHVQMLGIHCHQEWWSGIKETTASAQNLSAGAKTEAQGTVDIVQESSKHWHKKYVNSRAASQSHIQTAALDSTSTAKSHCRTCSTEFQASLLLSFPTFTP